MERDFLGLNSKDSFAVVKQEVKDGGRDSAFTRASGMQWSFSNKASALPQFLSFKTVQEDRPKNIVSDPLSSSVFMPVSTANSFDANNKQFTQKNFNLGRQGENYGLSAYTGKHLDAHSANLSQDKRMFSISNQTSSIAMGNPFFKTHIGTVGQNLSVTAMKQQPLGGIPIIAPYSVLPTATSMAGTIDSRNSFKSPGPPAQLTIFYGGSVAVYDDVSPEKAQTIMFLAGNGASTTSTTPNPRAQVNGTTHKPGVGDNVHGNQSHSTSPCSGLSSPLSITSHASPQSGSGLSRANESMTTKQMGGVGTLNSQSESPKMATARGSTAPTLMSSAVPQARKASLARFLEKRKERVMSTGPYNLIDKTSNITIPGSDDGISFSGNSGSSAIPAQVNKEQLWCLGPTKNEANTTNLQATLEI